MLKILLPMALALSACAAHGPDVTRAAAATATLLPGRDPADPGARRTSGRTTTRFRATLVHMVIQRESDYRPDARNGPVLGHDADPAGHGARRELPRSTTANCSNAETHLKYALRYLRGAWIVSGGDERAAMMWYAKGYYYEAKRQGVLYETGLRGGMWSKFDAGQAPMVPIDAKGHVLAMTASLDCAPAKGLARLVSGDGCA